jgi:ATP-binding cassette subfamily B multidrug efflux pump
MFRASDSDRAARVENPGAALRRLLAYSRPHRLRIGMVVLLVVAHAVFHILGPYLMGVAIDSYIEPGDAAGLARAGLAMVAVYLGMWLSQVGYGRIMAAVAQRIMRALRQDLFEHMQTLSMSFYDRQSAGDLMSRLTNDMDNINLLLSQNVVNFLSSFMTLVAVIGIMFVLNVWLTLATLIIVPIMVALVTSLMRRSGPAFREQQARLGMLNGLMEENLSGQRVIIAYGQQEATLADFGVANDAARKAAMRAQILAGLMIPFMMGLGNLDLAVVAGVGAFMAINGIAGVTVGLIATYTNYARHIGRPITEISNLFSAIVGALAGAERIFDVLDTEPHVQDKPDAVALEHIQGRVRFEGVDFSYVPGTPVLKDVSLMATPGQRVALVGPTGAGKTTIVNLLTRFYDVEDGLIYIDDHEIRDVQQDSLRRQLGIVLQDTYLFADTAMANIRYGRLDASDEEVIAAARLANADGFIRRLSDGYDTVLSERGSNLSQGQRQLLAIARAILADPRVLILDEATSSVDTRTEQLIQEGLGHLMEGRTSFVIAHRLSTIREADHILVINDGRIIERGTHESLLADRGFYYSLYMSQFKGTTVAA